MRLKDRDNNRHNFYYKKYMYFSSIAIFVGDTDHASPYVVDKRFTKDI